MSAPSDGNRLVAVFGDQSAGRSAVAALGDEGLEATVGGQQDHRDAVDAEMTDEATHAIGGPGLPLLNREIARGAIPASLIGAVIGALLGLPFAMYGWEDAGTAVVWSLIIGGLAGSTLGFFVGGILATRSVNMPLAAERGVTVSVPDGDRAREVLSDHDPIRIDVVAADGTKTALLTERDQHPEVFAERLGKSAAGHDREDEY